ncbi:hypothetical protein [Microbacterium sp. 22296]|uniref:hypothetical protein n=1 Tax=Microbacterium sp. 22296 TaxID=3453903 RepID=UPI003F8497EF
MSTASGGRTVSPRGSSTQRWVSGMEGSAVEVLLGALEARELAELSRRGVSPVNRR